MSSLYQYDPDKEYTVYAYLSDLQDKEREEKEIKNEEPFVWTDEMEEQLREHLKRSQKK